MPSRRAWEQAYRSVSRREPCRMCGKPDWCAVRLNDSVPLCRRVAEGGVHRVDKAGVDYWVHGPDGTPPRHPSAAEPRPRAEAVRADPDTLHEAYGTLLDRLALTSPHRQDLHRRGLADPEIARRQYRTLPRHGRAALARGLVEHFGPQVCARIPGLYVREARGRRGWSMAGAPGLVIPVRDPDGRIRALLVRSDDPNADARYSAVSSKKYGGSGPGAPCHVPLVAGADAACVRLTEGVLKADVATALSGVLTLGLPGVASWRTALPVLARLQPRRVLLAFDADAERKVAVARALWQSATALRQAGFAGALERWEETRGKGIDDLLAAGRHPEVLEGSTMWKALRAIQRHAHAVDPSLHRQHLLARKQQYLQRQRLPAVDPWLGPRAHLHGIPVVIEQGA
jgi:hypothetical protein